MISAKDNRINYSDMFGLFLKHFLHFSDLSILVVDGQQEVGDVLSQLALHQVAFVSYFVLDLGHL